MARFALSFHGRGPPRQSQKALCSPLDSQGSVRPPPASFTSPAAMACCGECANVCGSGEVDLCPCFENGCGACGDCNCAGGTASACANCCGNGEHYHSNCSPCRCCSSGCGRMTCPGACPSARCTQCLAAVLCRPPHTRSVARPYHAPVSSGRLDHVGCIPLTPFCAYSHAARAAVFRGKGIYLCHQSVHKASSSEPAA